MDWLLAAKITEQGVTFVLFACLPLWTIKKTRITSLQVRDYRWKSLPRDQHPVRRFWNMFIKYHTSAHLFTVMMGTRFVRRFVLLERRGFALYRYVAFTPKNVDLFMDQARQAGIPTLPEAVWE